MAETENIGNPLNSDGEIIMLFESLAASSAGVVHSPTIRFKARQQVN